MGVISKDNLGYLGLDFQYRLIQQLLVDRKFGESIVDILKPNYFEDSFLRTVSLKISDNYEQYGVIPDINNLESIIISTVSNDIDKEMYLEQFSKIRNAELNNGFQVQDTAMKFCKQQELKKSVREIERIIQDGNLDDYYKCEEILKKALEVGENKDDGMNVFDNIENVLGEEFRDPIPTGINGLDSYMDGGLAKGELGVLLAAFGIGKAQPLFSKVLTPNGWKTMGEIEVGDYVISRNGEKTKVIGVFPQGKRPIYKVSFNDGTSTLCDEEHLWAVNTINQRNRNTKKNGKNVTLPPDHSFKVLKTKDMINNVRVWNGRRLNYKIPNVNPVEFNKKELSIDPYLLGVIIGDGSITGSNYPGFVTKDIEIIDEVRKLYNNISINEYVREVEKDAGDEVVLVKRYLTKVNLLGIKTQLEELGLMGTYSHTKFIPNDYLYNSVENRVALLQGLVDTDGYINGHMVEVSTVSETLSEQIRELVLSLGGKVNITKKLGKYNNITCKEYFRISFSLPNNGVIPARLPRKVNKFRSRTKYSDNKFINSITYYGEEEAKCIMVDNEEHLYVTDDYIVTHNTTFMTKVANHAKNIGKNVLQIFFEDMPRVIQKKHLACWMEGKYTLNELNDNAEEVMEVKRMREEQPGKLILKKFPSDSTTIPHIKQYIKKLISQGFKPDILLLDYIDCVQPSKSFDNEWSGEGNVMRQFESLLAEFDIAGWTAVQGNRCVSLDTLVDINNKGRIMIKDVVIGDEILTHKGFKKITNVFPIEKQGVYEIKLKSGKTIKVSNKHQFPTTNGLKSIRDGLSVGDKLLTNLNRS